MKYQVMKPRLHLVSLCVAIVFVTYTVAVPVEQNVERKRRDLCAGNDDRCIEDNYWKEVLPLGFFVSNTGAGGASDTGGIKRGLPHGPLNGGGSGSGAFSTRSDIPGPKPVAAVAAPVANLAAETPLTQTMTSSSAASAPPSSSSSADKTTKTSVFCQGEKEWLQCPMYRVLKIKNAFWGRKDMTTCADKAVTRTLKSDKLCAQDEANTMKKVETMCNDEEACELVASDTFFDRADCPDVYKYVQLEYECLHREMRVKDTSDKSG